MLWLIPVGIAEGVVVDGIAVGPSVGIAEGVVVDGIAVGLPVGIAEGLAVVDGTAVGLPVGIAEGVVVWNRCRNISWDRRRCFSFYNYLTPAEKEVLICC